MAHRLHLVLGLGLLAAAITLAGCSSRTGESAPQAPATAAALASNAFAFNVGAYHAHALRDGTIEFPNDNQVFGIGHTPEEVAEVLKGADLPTDKLQLGLDPLLVATADHVLLFDTGAGGNFGDGAGHLDAALAAAGVAPASITDIFISHVHGDHVGGIVNADGTARFPHATIHLSQPEWDFLKGQTSESAGKLGITNYDALMAAMTPRVAPFVPGRQIIPGEVQAFEIRGHTPGHSGYLITDGQSMLLYIGDAMHHFAVSVRKPDWPNGFDADQATAAASRASLLKEIAPQDMRVYAVHFPFPGLGKFVQDEAGFRWLPE
jgi:glyoxylase-like metal-dependent hydrolase (beta-lactamase superfamily II)